MLQSYAIQSFVYENGTVRLSQMTDRRTREEADAVAAQYSEYLLAAKLVGTVVITMMVCDIDCVVDTTTLAQTWKDIRWRLIHWMP